jgi:hypothetical protein
MKLNLSFNLSLKIVLKFTYYYNESTPKSLITPKSPKGDFSKSLIISISPFRGPGVYRQIDKLFAFRSRLYNIIIKELYILKIRINMTCITIVVVAIAIMDYAIKYR